MTGKQITDKRSGAREPMVWLVVGLPLAAVFASVWLVVVAVRSGSDEIVADNVQHTGQIQTADLSPDALAAERKLGAVLQVDRGTVHVFPAGGAFARDKPLRLVLLHPQHQAADRRLELTPDATGWYVELPADDSPLDDSHDWIVHVTDAQATWRLRGRLPKGQRAAHLGPSLQVQ